MSLELPDGDHRRLFYLEGQMQEHTDDFDFSDTTFEGWVKFMEFMSERLGKPTPTREQLREIWEAQGGR